MTSEDISAGAGVFTVAIRDYTPAVPVLYFKPGAWCDTVNTSVTLAQVSGLVAPTHRHRRRLASRALLVAPTEYTVATACSLSAVSYTLGADGAPTTLTVDNATTGVYRLDIGNALPAVSMLTRNMLSTHVRLHVLAAQRCVNGRRAKLLTCGGACKRQSCSSHLPTHPCFAPG